MAPRLSRYFLVVLINLIIVCSSQIPSIAFTSFPSHTNTHIAGNTYSLPSWWNGQDCDASYYQANNPAHAPSQIMATWNGIEACKPEPGLDPNSPYIAPVQFVPNPNQTKEQEWQCTELVKRWMLLAWGLPSVRANGDQVVNAYANAYQNEVKQILNNGQTHVLPKVGDVLSYSTVHTALVIDVKIANPPSQGNATLTLLEQNASPTGMTKQQVINWVIKGGIDDPHHTQSDAVTGWLTPRSWSIFPGPKLSSNASLNSVAVVSSSDAWAVSGYLIEHWNGKHWSVVSNPGLGGLMSVTAISSTDVWAVGYYGAGNAFQTLTEHWNGSAWSVIPSPSFSGDDLLFSVTAVNSTDVWAVGTSCFPDGGCQTLTMNWNGSLWTVISSPNGSLDGVNILKSITVIASNDVWAVGYDTPPSGTDQTLTMNWNGSQWVILPSPNPGGATINNDLNSVSGTASNDVWVVGTSWENTSYQTLIEHWDGTSWSTVTSPNPGISDNLTAVVERTINDVWAVGSYTKSSTGIGLTLILHCYLYGNPSASCQWNVIPSPNGKIFSSGGYELNSIALVPTPSWEAWTVGQVVNNSSGPSIITPLIEHYT